MGYWDDPARFATDTQVSTNPFGNYTLMDSVPKELLSYVDPHWYQFPPMNPLWYGLLGFTMTVFGILSLLGNTIVIWVFMNTKSLRSPANLLIVNLALSDFIMMIFMFPPMVYCCAYGTWVFSGFFCEIYAFVGNICGCVSIYTMVFITRDRYNVIVKGVSADPLTSGKAMVQIAGVWTFAGVWTILPFFGWNRYVPEGNMTACGTDYLSEDFTSNLYLWIYGSFVWFCPLMFFIFSYYFIVAAVAAHEKGMREQAKKMGVKSLRTEEANKTSAECRLAKVAMVTVSLWFISWTPYMVINLMGMVAKDKISPLVTIWGSLFAKCAAVYNPIVYAISHPKYQAALAKKLPCLSCKSESVTTDNASTASTETTTPPVEK